MRICLINRIGKYIGTLNMVQRLRGVSYNVISTTYNIILQLINLFFSFISTAPGITSMTAFPTFSKDTIYVPITHNM